MDKILKYLEQLELSDVEAQMYVTLLQTGPISIRDLAVAVGIKRTTAYLYIEHLMQKGLVSRLTTGPKSHVEALNPDSSLETLVKDKLGKAQKMQQDFPDILQSIQANFSQTPDIGETEVRYFKGRLGVKRIYEDAVKATEIRSYFNCEIIKATLPENTPTFINALETNKNIKIFDILENSPIAKKQVSDFQASNPNNERYLYKFLPPEVRLSAADILIYDNKVAIVDVKNQLSGIIFHNSEYYKSSKELFDLIWKVLPEAKI